MKKVFKVVIINFLILISVLFFLEFSCYVHSATVNYFTCKKNNEEFSLKDFHKQYLEPMLTYDQIYHFYTTEENTRRVSGLNYKKPPVVIFGCSFAYGLGLEDKQTFSYKLSQYIKAPVYNFAIISGGIQHMLHQVELPGFFDNIKGEPSYVIYVYFEHMSRLYEYIWDIDSKSLFLRYEEKDGKLVRVKDLPGWINNYYLLKYMYMLKTKANRTEHYTLKTEKFALKHFLQAKETMEKHWKNTKYVFLFYRENPAIDDKERILMSDLEKNGFIVLTTEDLTHENFCLLKYQLSKDDVHPNEKAWDVLVPPLAKELNL